jgi:hypothetical protein
MYKVVKLFNDLKDSEHLYNVGDTYPREGLDVDDARINELLSEDNLQSTPLIKEIKKAQTKKETSKETK